MNWHTEPTYTATIYLAGDPVVAERVCREYCDEFGLCVTVSPTRFVYTRGEEAGVAVGLVNYPRFPKSPEQITDTAKHLALVLREKMDQESVMIVTPDRTYWDSYRHSDHAWENVGDEDVCFECDARRPARPQPEPLF